MAKAKPLVKPIKPKTNNAGGYLTRKGTKTSQLDSAFDYMPPIKKKK